MEEQLIKKQLIKNTMWTLCLFSIIIVIFNLVIYNQIKSSIYKAVDEKLLLEAEQIEKTKQISKEAGFEQKLLANWINPRYIYILRDEEGNTLNPESIGKFYKEYSLNTNFNKENIDNIYSISVKGNYNYRGITKKISLYNRIYYIQIITNVDGEVSTIKKLAATLIWGSMILIISYVYLSFKLSKKTLKPIIISWKKQTEFVQNASHELRTPLTIIQAKQQLLLQEPNSKIIDKSEDINLTIKETKRLTKLINELMILAMADSQELKLNKEKYNIDNIIKEIAVPYSDFAKMQNKTLEVKLNSNKEIEIDKSKVEQLIVILLDNAIKYTREGESITLSTYNKENKCYIEVVDTGIGISKEGAKHIFERFYRENKARTRETGGTGIGLSIAYTIVKLHGGTIKAMPNEPKGTKIVVRL